MARNASTLVAPVKAAVAAVTGNGQVEPRKGSKEVWQNEDGNWFWRLRSGNGAIIATAAEGYTRKAHCIKMMEQVCSGAYAHVAVRQEA